MKTIAELNEIRERVASELALRNDRNYTGREKHILVCRGTGCTSSKSPKIIENFRNILKEKTLLISLIMNITLIKRLF